MVLAFAADPMARWCWPRTPVRARPACRASRWRSVVVLLRMTAPDRTEDCPARPSGRLLMCILTRRSAREVVERTVSESSRGDLFAILEQMAKYHPVEPHWYLPLIGVDPRRIRTRVRRGAVDACSSSSAIAIERRLISSPRIRTSRCICVTGSRPSGRDPGGQLAADGAHGARPTLTLSLVLDERFPSTDRPSGTRHEALVDGAAVLHTIGGDTRVGNRGEVRGERCWRWRIDVLSSWPIRRPADRDRRYSDAERIDRRRPGRFMPSSSKRRARP